MATALHSRSVIIPSAWCGHATLRGEGVTSPEMPEVTYARNSSRSSQGARLGDAVLVLSCLAACFPKPQLLKACCLSQFLWVRNPAMVSPDSWAHSPTQAAISIIRPDQSGLDSAKEPRESQGIMGKRQPQRSLNLAFKALIHLAQPHPQFANITKLLRASRTLHAVSWLSHLAFAAHSVLLQMPFSIAHPLGKLLFIPQNPEWNPPPCHFLIPAE